MKNLVKDASMGPLREVLQQGVEITKLRKEDIRPVSLQVIFSNTKTSFDCFPFHSIPVCNSECL